MSGDVENSFRCSFSSRYLFGSECMLDRYSESVFSGIVWLFWIVLRAGCVMFCSLCVYWLSSPSSLSSSSSSSF